MRRVAVLAAVVALAAGCVGGDSEEKELQPGTLVVGVGGDHRAFVNGARVAAAEINGAGGIDRAVKLELVFADELDARRPSLGIAPCGVRAAAITFGPCGEVRTAMNGDELALALVEYAHDADADAVALAPGSARRRRALESKLRAAGVEVVADGADSDLLLSATPLEPGAPAPVDGVVHASHAFLDPGGRLDEFSERYRFFVGTRPRSLAAAFGYDATKALAAAVRDAGEVAPHAVAAAVGDAFEVHGALGTTRYDAGRPEFDAAIVRAEGGILELVARVRVP